MWARNAPATDRPSSLGYPKIERLLNYYLIDNYSIYNGGQGWN
jgi:hypothetical protein